MTRVVDFGGWGRVNFVPSWTGTTRNERVAWGQKQVVMHIFQHNHVGKFLYAINVLNLYFYIENC
jgi:hypothetical protein